MDRLMEMEAFANVVDQGGFTDAARKMGISKSAVSKHVSSLEARLGARLLNRTTRRVSPTEIGLAYYDRARRVLNDAGEADALVTSLHAAPSGLLRLTIGADLGPQMVSPLINAFLAEHPQVTVAMVVEDSPLDSAQYDVGLRLGASNDPHLRSQKLAEATKRLIASPSYLQAHGHPGRLDDLSEHRLLHYTAVNGDHLWEITAPSGERRQIRTSGTLAVNDGHSLLSACIASLGIAYLPSFIYSGAMADGLVVDVMPALPA
ncbi:MAG: LysR family transcriptional regulator, partial [Paracoccaceae bacterium]